MNSKMSYCDNKMVEYHSALGFSFIYTLVNSNVNYNCLLFIMITMKTISMTLPMVQQ